MILPTPFRPSGLFARLARPPARRDWRRRITTAVAVIAVPFAIAACNPFGGTAASVSDLITQAQNSLNQIISTTNGALRSDALLVQQELDHFSQVYQADLNMTVDKLDDAVQEQLDTVMSLTNELQRGVTTDIQQATSSLQLTLDKLPFTSHLPEIKSFAPNYVIGGDSGTTVFTFTGDFEDAVKGGKFVPRLVLCPCRR